MIDASGYGRVLPRLLNIDSPSKLNPHSAIFTHIDDVRRPEGREGTQISFDIIETKVWLWVIPFRMEKQVSESLDQQIILINYQPIKIQRKLCKMQFKNLIFTSIVLVIYHLNLIQFG